MSAITCTRCDGTGDVIRADGDRIVPCPACNGYGTLDDDPPPPDPEDVAGYVERERAIRWRDSERPS